MRFGIVLVTIGLAGFILPFLGDPATAQSNGNSAAKSAEIKLNVKERVLKNGLKVLLLERHDVPRISCWIYFKVGSVNERTGITGISHFMEHLMFKGTDRMGIKDAALDRKLNAKINVLGDKIRRIRIELGPDGIKSNENFERAASLNNFTGHPPKGRAQFQAMLQYKKEMDELLAQEKKIIIKDELWETYLKNGGSSLNAFTSYDMTGYKVTIPSNRLELFMWMEADRMSAPVFREFFPEREVVKEERRLRTEDPPYGRYGETFNAVFYDANPYSWPVVGWMSDLNNITPEHVYTHFNTYYRPNNAVMVLVGDFKTEKTFDMINDYFGGIPRAKVDPPPVATLEPKGVAEKRITVRGKAQSYLSMAYHTPRIGHPDTYPLEVAGEILSGKSGRLYKILVEEKKVATSAQAYSSDRRYAGRFSLSVSLKGEATHAEVEELLEKEIDRLKTVPVTQRDLDRVKNQIEAHTIMGMNSIGGLASRLGRLETMYTWRELIESPKKIAAVTADDVQRVAKKYLIPENRTVGHFIREKEKGQ